MMLRQWLLDWHARWCDEAVMQALNLVIAAGLLVAWITRCFSG